MALRTLRKTSTTAGPDAPGLVVREVQASEILSVLEQILAELQALRLRVEIIGDLES